MTGKLLLTERNGDALTTFNSEDLGNGKRRIHVITSQDVQPILDANRIEREFSRLNKRRLRDDEMKFRPVFDAPPFVLAIWKKKYGLVVGSPKRSGMSRDEYNRLLRKLMNDPDLAAFKMVDERL